MALDGRSSLMLTLSQLCLKRGGGEVEVVRQTLDGDERSVPLLEDVAQYQYKQRDAGLHSGWRGGGRGGRMGRGGGKQEMRTKQ